MLFYYYVHIIFILKNIIACVFQVYLFTYLFNPFLCQFYMEIKEIFFNFKDIKFEFWHKETIWEHNNSRKKKGRMGFSFFNIQKMFKKKNIIKMFESRRLLECLETDYYQNTQERKIMSLIMIFMTKRFPERFRKQRVLKMFKTRRLGENEECS